MRVLDEFLVSRIIVFEKYSNNLIKNRSDRLMLCNQMVVLIIGILQIEFTLFVE